MNASPILTTCGLSFELDGERALRACRGVRLKAKYTNDFVVEKSVVELKSVADVAHIARVPCGLRQSRLTGLQRRVCSVDFNVPLLVDPVALSSLRR